MSSVHTGHPTASAAAKIGQSSGSRSPSLFPSLCLELAVNLHLGDEKRYSLRIPFDHLTHPPPEDGSHENIGVDD
jgi:hypothetical protein